PKQPRAKFYRTVHQMAAVLVSQIWNDTGTRGTPCRSLPARRKHNDLKSQTMSRSQPRRLRHAGWISYCLNRACGATAQMFSSASAIGAAPVAVTSGGVNGTLGRMVACGSRDVCLMRVDISIAVKRRAAAR